MNKRIFPRLIRKGDCRIGQRGEYSPAALYNYHNQTATDAADNLRRLVNRTFGDNAEAVTEQIRKRYDQAVPETSDNATLAEEITSLKAIVAFYHEVRDEILEGVLEPPRTEPETIYEMAKELIEGKSQWSSGEAAKVWTGKTFAAYIVESGSDGGGLLYLGFAGPQWRREEVVAGHLNPRKGWTFTLSQSDYDVWVARAKRMTKAKGWQPDLVMDFGKGGLSQSPVSHLSPEYAKRARRARDLR